MTSTFKITPSYIAKVLFAIVGILLVLHLIGSVFFTFVMGYDRALNFIPAFYFGEEANVPAVYSSLAIFFAAILLWMIGNLESEREKQQTLFWKILAGVFVFLAIDELISIHERLTSLGRAMAGATISAGEASLLKYAWFIPYCLVFGVISLFFLRFFFRLPYRTRKQFMVAGIVFIAGAVGMEVISGYYSSMHDMEVRDLNYTLMVTVEELLEMVGIIIFIHALSGYYIAHVERGFLEIRCQVSRDGEIRPKSTQPQLHQIS